MYVQRKLNVSMSVSDVEYEFVIKLPDKQYKISRNLGETRHSA